MTGSSGDARAKAHEAPGQCEKARGEGREREIHHGDAQNVSPRPVKALLGIRPCQ